ncbi:membrane protein [Escherichia coli]|nr:membrane protein [Escherichia coli]
MKMIKMDWKFLLVWLIPFLWVVARLITAING